MEKEKLEILIAVKITSSMNDEILQKIGEKKNLSKYIRDLIKRDLEKPTTMEEISPLSEMIQWTSVNDVGPVKIEDLDHTFFTERPKR